MIQLGKSYPELALRDYVLWELSASSTPNINTKWMIQVKWCIIWEKIGGGMKDFWGSEPQKTIIQEAFSGGKTIPAVQMPQIMSKDNPELAEKINDFHKQLWDNKIDVIYLGTTGLDLVEGINYPQWVLDRAKELGLHVEYMM